MYKLLSFDVYGTLMDTPPVSPEPGPGQPQPRLGRRKSSERFVADSPLEGRRFEPLVPLHQVVASEQKAGGPMRGSNDTCLSWVGDGRRGAGSALEGSQP